MTKTVIENSVGCVCSLMYCVLVVHRVAGAWDMLRGKIEAVTSKGKDKQKVRRIIIYRHPMGIYMGSEEPFRSVFKLNNLVPRNIFNRNIKLTLICSLLFQFLYFLIPWFV